MQIWWEGDGETFPDLGHINEEKILEVSHVSNRRLKDVSLVLRKGRYWESEV